jgi:alkanesulfonate monooxygenase
MGSRQMRLGAFMRPVGIHTAWWRYPGAYPDANFNLKHLIRFAQKLEQGRFDAWFMADQSGRPEHADGGAEAQRDGDLV